MKNIYKGLIACAAVGVALLGISASAFAQTGGSGYQAFKDAVVNTVVTHNATVSAKFEVKDNGAVAASGSTVRKFDGRKSMAQTSVEKGGAVKEYDSSGNAKKDPDTSAQSSSILLAKAMADTLAGDVKNAFVTNGSHITLDLKGDQIPQLARLAIAAAAENLRSGWKDGDEAGPSADATISDVLDVMPPLKDTDVESMQLAADVSNGYVTNGRLDIVITGTDDKGALHRLAVSVNADISAINSTSL